VDVPARTDQENCKVFEQPWGLVGQTFMQSVLSFLVLRDANKQLQIPAATDPSRSHHHGGLSALNREAK